MHSVGAIAQRPRRMPPCMRSTRRASCGGGRDAEARAPLAASAARSSTLIAARSSCPTCTPYLRKPA